MTDRTSEIVVQTQQCIANAGQAPGGAFSANNFSLEPRVEELTRIIAGGQTQNRPAEAGTSNRIFGAHLREAAAVIRDWVKNP